jgi:hypothetical protein
MTYSLYTPTYAVEWESPIAYMRGAPVAGPQFCRLKVSALLVPTGAFSVLIEQPA